MNLSEGIKRKLGDIEILCGHCPYEGEPNGCNRPEGTCKMFDVAQDALDLIEQIEARVPHWISVEQPPKKDGRYLALFEDDQIADIDFYADEEGGFGWWKEYFDISTMSVVDSEWQPCITVAYWMPRPELPMEEEHE